MILSVDTETTGTDFIHGCRPYLVSMCNGNHNFYWKGEVNFNREVTWSQNDLEDIQEMLDEATTLIFHNTNFDMEALASIGIKIDHLWTKIEDTLLASHLLDSDSPHGLKELSLRYFRFSDEDETIVKSAVMRNRLVHNYKDVDYHPSHPASKSHWKADMWLALEECLTYAVDDAERTWLLWKLFKHQMTSWGLLKPYNLRKKLLPICFKIKQNGIHLYEDKIKERIEYLKHQSYDISKTLSSILNLKWIIDLGSEKDKRMLFFVHLKLPQVISEKGNALLNVDVIDNYLQTYEYPELDLYREWRDIRTEITYLTSYLAWTHDSRLHANLNITGTRETRQSSSDPNVQNIAKPLRQFMGPPPGKVWFEIDCVNIELRIWAYAVKSRDLIERFERGESIHLMICRVLHPELNHLSDDEVKETDEYGYTKNGNFALIYGASEDKADSTYKVKNACQKISRVFPEIINFSKYIVRTAEENVDIYYKPCVFTLGGYKLNVPRGEEYKACNYYIQGSAGIIMTEMMIAVDQHFPEVSIINQVHDSLYIEADEDQTHLLKPICEVMEQAGQKYIPTCFVSTKIIKG